MNEMPGVYPWVYPSGFPPSCKKVDLIWNKFGHANAGWKGNFLEDNGEMAGVITKEFLTWVSDVSDYWSGYFSLSPGENFDYYIYFGELMYIGDSEDEDAKSLNNHFR